MQIPDIKIAFLIDSIDADTGGTEKQLLNIIQRLNKNRIDVVLICLYETPWMRENKIPIRVINLGYRGIIKANLLKVIMRLSSLFEREQFDIVQTFFEESIYIAFIACLFSRHKPVLLSSRRDLGLGSDEPFYHFFYKRAKPFIMRFYEGVVVNAEAIKEHVVKHESILPCRVTVIPNGLDIPITIAAKPLIIQAHPRSVWVGIVANLKPIKRIDLFIEALAYIMTHFKDKDIRGVVLGDGHLRASLESMVRDLGISNRIFFAGACTNVNDYLQHIDIGVLCSDKEGLSNAILEYMANGLPVVATRVGGNPELVDERNGICVSPGNASALADALSLLVESLDMRKKMGAESLQKIHDYYLWDKVIPKWENLYQNVKTGKRMNWSEYSC